MQYSNNIMMLVVFASRLRPLLGVNYFQEARPGAAGAPGESFGVAFCILLENLTAWASSLAGVPNAVAPSSSCVLVPRGQLGPCVLGGRRTRLLGLGLVGLLPLECLRSPITAHRISPRFLPSRDARRSPARRGDSLVSHLLSSAACVQVPTKIKD